MITTTIYSHPDGHEITVSNGLLTAVTSEGAAASIPIGPDGLAALGHALLERATFDRKALATAAIKFARAATDVTQHKEQLTNAYYAWRVAAGVHETILRDDENWVSMMTASSNEHRQLQNAKGRERSAKKKLLALAGEVEATQ